MFSPLPILKAENNSFFYMNSAPNLLMKRMVLLSFLLFCILLFIVVYLDTPAISLSGSIFASLFGGFLVNYYYNVYSVHAENKKKDKLVLDAMHIFFEMSLLPENMKKESCSKKKLTYISFLKRKAERYITLVASLKPEIVHFFELAQQQLEELESALIENKTITNLDVLKQLNQIFYDQENQKKSDDFIKYLETRGAEPSSSSPRTFFSDGEDFQIAYRCMIKGHQAKMLIERAVRETSPLPLTSPHLIPLPQKTDPRGDLTFIEANHHIPFAIKRVYYLYNIPDASIRGAHAHEALHQLMIAVSGSFDVTLDDGLSPPRKITLNNPAEGLYICPMIWRDLGNFSADAVCMVLASEYYTEEDYYRDYDEFLAAVRNA